MNLYVVLIMCTIVVFSQVYIAIATGVYVDCITNNGLNFYFGAIFNFVHYMFYS